MAPKESNDELEWILKQSKYPVTFVDFSKSISEEGSEWMSSPISAYYWGIYEYKLVPNEQYDGVILVDEVSVN